MLMMHSCRDVGERGRTLIVRRSNVKNGYELSYWTRFYLLSDGAKTLLELKKLYDSK